MEIVQVRDKQGRAIPLWKIDGDRIRIEATPLRKREVATDELLSNARTSSHYFAGERSVPVRDPSGRQVVGKDGKPVTKKHLGVDASGKPIQKGKPMDYIDWLNPTRVYQVYVKQQVDGKERFIPVGSPYPTPEAAIGAAVEL